MGQYHGEYRGIVIQNNDPINAGRVKVFVPEVNVTLLKNWNKDLKEDKAVTHMGDNTGTSLTPEIQDRLRKMLPWAEVSFPIFGMSTPAFYDAAANKSYIGNDGGLTSQDSNKTAEAFEQDKSEESQRKNAGPTTDSHAKSPRQSIYQVDVNTGKTMCLPTNCGSGNPSQTSFPSIYLNYKKNSCIYDLIQNQPKSYPLCDTTIVPPSDTDPINDFGTDKNISISRITLDVQNPDITINDKKVDVNATIFGVKCFVPIDNTTIRYNPPILFETSTSSDFPANYNDIPIRMTINGSNKITQDFYYYTMNGNSYIYKAGNMTVGISADNINKITLATNGSPTNISKLQKILPLIIANLGLLQTIGNIIMPRGTTNNTMVSRGGGGGELYNHVNSSLLPEQTRRNSLIGAHNNASKYTQNQGRSNASDYKSNTEANLLGKPDMNGPYRPSDQNNNYKGVVSIPSPGAHVWVRFEQGDPNRPIVVGTFTSKNDMKNIYGSETK